MLALLLSLAPVLAAPPIQGVPANDGWITDQAGLLSAGQEAELEALAESFRRGSGNQIAVLTVKDLDGTSLEDLAFDTAQAWMGKDADRGALLLVAHEDRELRIEVGRDLEGNLTDSIAGRIIRDVIVPHFKQGDFPEGIRQGVLAIHGAVGGDYGPIEAATQRREESGLAQALSSLCTIAFLLMFILPSILGGRRGYHRGGSVLPWLILGSMASGGSRRGGGFGGGGFSSGGFGGFSGGGGGFGGGGASGSW